MTHPHITPALRAEARRIAHSTWMGASVRIRNTLDAIADAVLEAALAAAPKQAPVRTAAGDTLADAADNLIIAIGMEWDLEGVSKKAHEALAAYRAADPEPWGCGEVEGLVRAARHALASCRMACLDKSTHLLVAALRPFATIAEQDGVSPAGNTSQPGKAPAAGAPAPNMSVCAHCGTWRSKICGEGCTWGVSKNEHDAGFRAMPEGAHEQAEQDATALHAAPDPRLAAIAAWREGRFIGKAQEAAAAIHDILADLLADRDARKEREKATSTLLKQAINFQLAMTRQVMEESRHQGAWYGPSSKLAVAFDALAAALAGGRE